MCFSLICLFFQHTKLFWLVCCLIQILCLVLFSLSDIAVLENQLPVGVIMLSRAHDIAVLQETEGLWPVHHSPAWITLGADNGEDISRKRRLFQKSSLQCSGTTGRVSEFPYEGCTVSLTVTCSDSGSLQDIIKVQNVCFWSHTLPQFKPVSLLFPSVWIIALPIPGIVDNF